VSGKDQVDSRFDKSGPVGIIQVIVCGNMLYVGRITNIGKLSPAEFAGIGYNKYVPRFFNDVA
jgi:hypothetical protein